MLSALHANQAHGHASRLRLRLECQGHDGADAPGEGAGPLEADQR